MHLHATFLAAAACAAMLPAQMAGTYIIDPSGSASFRTFQEAVNAMFVQGINGPVDILVAPGTYTESVLVPPLPGTAQNRITFKPLTTALSVQLMGGAGNTFTFIGASFMKCRSIDFDGLHFVSAPGYALEGTRFTEDFEVRNCRIDGNHRATATGTFYHALVYSENSGNDMGWRFHHNQLQCPSHTNRTAYGFYISNAGGWEIHHNEFDLNGCDTCLWLINNNRTLDTIWNNLFHGSLYATTSTSFNSVCVIRADISNYDNDIVHNTFQVTISGNGCIIATGGLGGTSPATNRIYGNVMSLTGSGTCIVASSATVPILSDGNVFWAPTGEVGRIGSSSSTSTVHQTLAAWQAATSQDLVSVEQDPLFLVPVAPYNLHVVPSSPVTNVAVNTPAYVTTDFDGRLRDAQPDAGAYESTSFAMFGAGCPGTGGLVPQLGSSGTVALGSTNFAVTLSQAPPTTLAILVGGFSRTMAGSLPLPFDIGGGCFVRTSQEAVFTTFTDGSGNAMVPVNIPSNPNLIGTNVYFQWAVLDPASGSPFGFTTSQAGALQL